MNAKLFFSSEPYRWFFPLGVIFLLWGSLVWLPLVWGADTYPVTLHRFLMLNGFVACFIAGFLMTAIPRFSQTANAHFVEVILFSLTLVVGILFSHVAFASMLQAGLLLIFILRRIGKRKQNPPYSFIFIFVGLALWLFASFHAFWFESAKYSLLHYEGAIAAIILGVGSRLIPGILGHVEVVKSQRDVYEKPVSLIKSIPLPFLFLIVIFVQSYFFDFWAVYFRAAVVTIIAFSYWRLHQFPKERTALTWSLWICAWMITLSFLVKLLPLEGEIHLSHAFFLSGIVIICFLVATRVIQSHGPKEKSLEDLKLLYCFTGLMIFAMLTRLSAFYLPHLYSSHLAYSAIVVVAAVILWSYRYLGFIRDA